MQLLKFVILQLLLQKVHSAYVRSPRDLQDTNCLVSTNPEYENMIALDDTATFYYSVIDNSLKAQIAYTGSGWVAWAHSPTGMMVGSSAVIGLPDDNAVGMYDMTSKSTIGVTLAATQSLEDSSIVQDDSGTTLTFTRPLEDPNTDLTIDASGDNFFLWAVGLSNTLGYHSKRAAFTVDLAAVCEGEVTTGEIVDEEEMPVEAMVEEEEMPVEALVEEDEECPGQSDLEDYDTMISLSDELTFHYRIVDDMYLSAQFVFQGIGWVAWAASPTGMMVGGEAVIGLPSEESGASNPGKYNMASKSTLGVTLMESQTLRNASVVQDDTTTTLTFQKLLNEEGEHPIDPTGLNTFLWAVGSSNDLSYHLSRATFEVDLGASCSAPVVAIAPKAIPLSYWKIHGILLGVSWAFLTPFAVLSAINRSLFKGPLWFKIHFLLNALSTVCTVAGVAVAIVAYQQGGVAHFNDTHQQLGLAVCIIVILHSIGGMMRPHVEKDEPKSKQRQIWEPLHKVTGWFLLAAGMFQVATGLKLYQLRALKDNLVNIYFIWLIVFFVVALGVTGFKFHKSRNTEESK